MTTIIFKRLVYNFPLMQEKCRTSTPNLVFTLRDEYLQPSQFVGLTIQYWIEGIGGGGGGGRYALSTF